MAQIRSATQNLQIDFNVVIDALIPGRVENIINLVDSVKYVVFLNNFATCLPLEDL